MIELEGHLRSIDGHRYWSNGGDGLLQGVLVAFAHVDEACAFGANGVGIETARTVLLGKTVS